MALNFKPAVRHEAKARVAVLGPTGAGKTWTALQWATVLGGRIGVIDTENTSASLYSDDYDFDTAPWGPPYDAAKLAAAVAQAAEQYDVLILDSLTHFWAGDGGVLDVVDREAVKNRGNTYAAWKVGSPLWRGLLDALIFAPCHVIVTMRSKMDYLQQKGDDGRTKIEKVGMAPQARNDVEYEFTVVAELDQGHRLTITKSRCSALADQVAPPHQAEKLAVVLRDWLGSADAAAAPTRPEPEPEADPNAPTDAQIAKIAIELKRLGVVERSARLVVLSDHVGRALASSKDMTRAEASAVIDALMKEPTP
jgi:hypothetical protein